MTVDQIQREQQQQRPPSDQRAANLAREHGNRIAEIADIAEQQLEDADRERGGRNRLEDGLQVLRWLVGAPWSERTLEIDRVLHDEHGSLSEAKVTEYIRLLLAGESSLDARYAMVGRHVQHAQVARSAIAGAREVSANLHRMAEPPRVQPALPVASVPAPRNGTELPHREPIAPALPPMFPPAPPETPPESTGQLIQRVRDNGHTVTPEQEAAARKDHQSAPDFGPGAPAEFGVSSLPAVRAGDTQVMPAVPDTDQVLADLAMGDASAGDPKDKPAARNARKR